MSLMLSVDCQRTPRLHQGVAYPGRFSIQLIPFAVALSVCVVMQASDTFAYGWK